MLCRSRNSLRAAPHAAQDYSGFGLRSAQLVSGAPVMMRFSGGRWKGFGPVRSGIDPGAVSEGFKAIFKYGSSTRDAAGQQNANTVTMMTGSFGGTYVQIGADLASVLDDGHNFRFPAVAGGGTRISSSRRRHSVLEGVDARIVRTDTLDKGYSSNIKKQFACITKLYNEEMHVVAAKTIRSIKDLDGETVVVDLPDGASSSPQFLCSSNSDQAAFSLYRAARGSGNVKETKYRRRHRG
jgi:hypothetical protein